MATRASRCHEMASEAERESRLSWENATIVASANIPAAKLQLATDHRLRIKAAMTNEPQRTMAIRANMGSEITV